MSLTKRQYSTYVLLTSSLAATVLSVVINVLLMDRAFNEADRQRAEVDRRSCSTLAALIAVYDESPPQTETGKGVELAYRDQFNAFNCSTVLSSK